MELVFGIPPGCAGSSLHSSFLLRHPLEGSRWWLKYLAYCSPQACGFGLLNPECYRRFGSDKADRSQPICWFSLSLPLFISLCMCIFFPLCLSLFICFSLSFKYINRFVLIKMSSLHLVQQIFHSNAPSITLSTPPPHPLLTSLSVHQVTRLIVETKSLCSLTFCMKISSAYKHVHSRISYIWIQFSSLNNREKLDKRLPYL